MGRSTYRGKLTSRERPGMQDLGDTYYQHWLLALESLVKTLPP